MLQIEIMELALVWHSGISVVHDHHGNIQAQNEEPSDARDLDFKRIFIDPVEQNAKNKEKLDAHKYAQKCPAHDFYDFDHKFGRILVLHLIRALYSAKNKKLFHLEINHHVLGRHQYRGNVPHDHNSQCILLTIFLCPVVEIDCSPPIQQPN